MLHTTAALPASVPLQAAGRWLRGAWRHFLQSEEEVAFPAGGSPSLTALRLGEPQGGGKWDLIASRDTEGGNVWGCLRGAAGDHACSPPFPLRTTPAGLEDLQHAGDTTAPLKQKLPSADTTLCGLLTRLRGPSITSIDPGVSGGLRKGSNGAGAHGGKE